MVSSVLYLYPQCPGHTAGWEKVLWDQKATVAGTSRGMGKVSIQEVI